MNLALETVQLDKSIKYKKNNALKHRLKPKGNDQSALSPRLVNMRQHLPFELPLRVIPFPFQSIMTYLQLCLSAVPTETPGIHHECYFLCVTTVKSQQNIFRKELGVHVNVISVIPTYLGLGQTCSSSPSPFQPGFPKYML